MTDESAWERVAEIFATALEQPSDRRESWLDEACGPDVELRGRVEALLTADARATGILENPMTGLASIALARGDSRLAGREVAPDEHVGPYRVLREAGRGGMGIVYQAYDPRLRRFVALKLLPRLAAEDEVFSDRVLGEARAAAALDHPNICTVYDVGQTDGGDRYIAMAYYAGQTLAQRLRGGAVGVGEAVDIVRQLLSGLSAAHERRIVHRDVKPSNVLITSRNEVKILDFGIATIRHHDASESARSRLGTPAYMAPEQFQGRVVDHRADLWAVGVILYEMLAGHRPFRGRTVAEQADAVRSHTPAPIGRGSHLHDVVARALAKSPTDRQPDAAAFLADLDRAVPEARAERLGGAALPRPVTSLVGREDDVREIVGLLEQTRLVTLTGPGGAGKTRLSLEVARQLVGRLGDGVRFVPLSSVADVDAVPHAMAQHLGLTEASVASVDQIAHALADADMLLVLDSFEHLTGAAPLLADLLTRCARIRLLVTSRSALRLHAEQEWAVSPLTPPPPDSTSVESNRRNPAVALFVARAQAIRPTFRLDETTVSPVADLCRALDGLPLAIELAAAQIRWLTPEAILTRLGRHMELLEGGPVDAPRRHRTLREAVAWSFDLLSDGAQRLFQRLSILEGGASLDAIEVVGAAEPHAVSDVLRELATLVDQSLLRQEQVGLEPRFDMLQTIRAFAAGRFEEVDVVERDAVRLASARHFAALAERAEPHLTGTTQTEWLDRLERERHNLRVAMERSIESGHAGLGVRIGAALWRLWLVRGPLAEGRQLLEHALAAAPDDVPGAVRAKALAGLGTIAHNQGDNQLARERLQESLRLWRALDDRRGVASALTDLAWVHCELSELESAQTLSTEALALHREMGERRGTARALNNLGWIANYQADYRRARAYLEEGLTIRRDIGDERGVAFALASLAWAEEYHGDLERADGLLAEALTILERVNDPLLLTFSNLHAARLHEHRGDLDRARDALDALTPLAHRCGNASLAAWADTATGRVALARGDAGIAEARLASARETWRAIDCRWGYATALVPSAELLSVRRDPRAAEVMAEAVEIFQELPDPRGVADAWDTLARCVEGTEPERARRLRSDADELRRASDLPGSRPD